MLLKVYEADARRMIQILNYKKEHGGGGGACRAECLCVSPEGSSSICNLTVSAQDEAE